AYCSGAGILTGRISAVTVVKYKHWLITKHQAGIAAIRCYGQWLRNTGGNLPLTSQLLPGSS
ncbi:MAG: hypothetical protein ACKN9X_09130, partial [Candidatus Methylopumilus sp.]